MARKEGAGRPPTVCLVCAARKRHSAPALPGRRAPRAGGAQLAGAMAVSYVTRLPLVMPQLVCYCDVAWCGLEGGPHAARAHSQLARLPPSLDDMLRWRACMAPAVQRQCPTPGCAMARLPTQHRHDARVMAHLSRSAALACMCPAAARRSARIAQGLSMHSQVPSAEERSASALGCCAAARQPRAAGGRARR